MFRPALGAVGRILLRSQAAAARSLSRPAGASRLLRHLHSQQAHLGDGAAATAGHRFGFSRSSSLKPHATAIAGWSTAGAAFWYMKSLPSEINWLKANVVP
ncbi:uncharacterized protein [Triticum aestivum]|uniref:uncharacterized protein isoform X2 n=1 Tax=Triticum aestivum TaxID=4565 RepID=UPI001D02011A|nr:uncharacterized protein LOC123050517 isoform X2 [Triticum aestivum]